MALSMSIIANERNIAWWTTLMQNLDAQFPRDTRLESAST
jgi:hypothetical protein